MVSLEYIHYLPKLESIERHVQNGLISKVKHSEYPLYIYNYTRNTVFERYWDQHTVNCRGLILDNQGNVISRPFPKFFNVEDYASTDDLFTKPFQIHEKLDGSLGIMYPTPDGGYAVASRGHFHSPQAQFATEALQKSFKETPWIPNPDYTYIFEIIYPQNRIVVDYGDFAGLVFLAAIHTETGSNLFNFGNASDYPGPIPKIFTFENDHPKNLEQFVGDNQEGFVLYFPHANTRLKVKGNIYKELHKIVTGTNTKTIWQWLRSNRSIEHLLESVPDECDQWIREEIENFKHEFSLQESLAQFHFDQAKEYIETHYGPLEYNRKEFADHIKSNEYRDIMFLMASSWNYRDNIWKRIKPTQLEYPPFRSMFE